MPKFDRDGVAIHYSDEAGGSGTPVVLVHGFASSLDGNYRRTGIIDALLAAGHRVIAIDCRGHGESEKPHDPAAYEGTTMADDVIALLDHLGLERAAIMGYSMGGFLTASIVVRAPERVTRAIIAGVGDALIRQEMNQDRQRRLSAAFDAADGKDVEDPVGKGFRRFAQATGADVTALAAMQRASRGGFDARRIADTTVPLMILIGADDQLVGDGAKLAAFIPQAKHVVVPGNHLSAVVAPELKRAVVEWFGDG